MLVWDIGVSGVLGLPVLTWDGVSVEIGRPTLTRPGIAFTDGTAVSMGRRSPTAMLLLPLPPAVGGQGGMLTIPPSPMPAGGQMLEKALMAP